MHARSGAAGAPGARRDRLMGGCSRRLLLRHGSGGHGTTGRRRKRGSGWTTVRTVDTIVRPPEAPPVDAPEARGEHPWRRRSVLVLVVVLGIGIVVGGSWASNYDPLVQGNYGYGTPPTRDSEAQSIDAFGVSGSVFRVSAERGMTFRYSFSVRNDGSVPVQIMAIGQHGDGPVGTMAVAMNPVIDGGGSTDAGTQPFEPFQLA